MIIRGFTFDPTTGLCEEFDEAGCGLTGNGFRTKEKCESTCGSKGKPLRL